MSQVELVLVVSDLNIPNKVTEIPEQFKEVLAKAKINHVLCLGNIGNQETYNYLKNLSKNFHCVKGDLEDFKNPYNEELNDSKVVKIGNFKIGLIHGHQIVPWEDLNSLSIYRKRLECDILLSGYTGNSSFYTYEGKHYINPGSFTGSYSPINPTPIPSFVVLLIDNEVGVSYQYELKDLNKRYEISKFEFKKLPDEVFEAQEEED